MELPEDRDRDLNAGSLLLTPTGKELATVCDPSPVEGFEDYSRRRSLIVFPTTSPKKRGTHRSKWPTATDR